MYAYLDVFDASGGSTNYRSLAVSGTFRIVKKHYVSVWVYSSNDNSWQMHSESGFSCHRFAQGIGFHAVKGETQGMGQGFALAQNWRVSGGPTLYAAGVKMKNPIDKFEISESGYYFCYMNLRVDRVGRQGYFRAFISMGDRNFYNGLHAVEGDHGSQDKRYMNVAGTLDLKKGNTVSVFTFSSDDPSYKLNSESGFGCHIMSSNFGFHATMAKPQSIGTGWTGS